jgi:hypothetical protein
MYIVLGPESDTIADRTSVVNQGAVTSLPSTHE